MLTDTTVMNPKGHVKLELYDEDGVFFTKEKHNLVVLDANKIVAEMMANPSRKTRISKTLKVDTIVNGEGKHIIELPFAHEKVFTFEKDLGSNAVTELKVEDTTHITAILEATLDDNPLKVDSEIFIKDGVKGMIGFGGVGATGTLKVKYRKVVNQLTDLVRGAEVVKIGPDTWKKGTVPRDNDKVYTVDFSTGVLVFENAKASVNVSYDYEMEYSLGFMGIGGLPNNHLAFQPVSFSKSDKYRANMDNEFLGSRQPIIFPATIETGKPEIDVLLAKNVSVLTKTKDPLVITDDGVNVDRTYTLEVATLSGDKPLYKLKVVKAKNGSNAGYDFLANNEVSIKDIQAGKIEFTSGAPLEIGHELEVEYELRVNTDHLRYQLNFSPVVELKSVRFEDNFGVVHDIAVDATTRGMDLGQTGKVYVVNPNQGLIEFSQDVEDILMKLPGTLTVEYFVNSGTVVKFVADFPKGTPGPVVAQAPDFIPDTMAGATTYEIPSQIDSIDEVLIAGNPSSGYTRSGQQITITDPAFQAGVNVTVRYKTLKETHDVYTVAMFDDINPATSKMFNISGIGPVTKDKNTGMRVTWSVTF